MHSVRVLCACALRVLCRLRSGRPEITPGGVMQAKTEFVGSMRANYDVWYKTMQEQDAIRAS